MPLYDGSGQAIAQTTNASGTTSEQAIAWVHSEDDVTDAWGHWVSSSCTSCSTNASTGVWKLWASTTSSNTISTHAWGQWVNNAQAVARAALANRIHHHRPRVETAEERRAREEAHVKQMAEIAARQKAEEEKRMKAKRRAKKLLMDFITKPQRESLEKHGFFEVLVNGKTYRIRQGTHGNVRLIENGKETKSFCIQPNGIPDEDAMLAQKLLLETNEAEFLRIANARAMN